MRLWQQDTTGGDDDDGDDGPKDASGADASASAALASAAVPAAPPIDSDALSAVKKAQQIAQILDLQYKQTQANAAAEASDNHFEDELEINDYPQQARWRVTQKEASDSISELTGAAVIARGSYVPAGRKPNPGERKLYLVRRQSSRTDLCACVRLTHTPLLSLLLSYDRRSKDRRAQRCSMRGASSSGYWTRRRSKSDSAATSTASTTSSTQQWHSHNHKHTGACTRALGSGAAHRLQTRERETRAPRAGVQVYNCVWSNYQASK